MKQNHSHLIPSAVDRSSKLSNFNQTGAHRVSLRSITNAGDLPNDIVENSFVPPRVGKSLALSIR